MARFRTIDYGKMLYETMRAYFAVNSAGEMSGAFKVCAAAVAVLQQPFNSYDVYRKNASIIAGCYWQVGQLTNVLNYLFDTDLKRIFITQSEANSLSDPVFGVDAIHFDPIFGEGTPLQERTFFDKSAHTAVLINIPDTVNEAAIIPVIEQIKLQGIAYQIQII